MAQRVIISSPIPLISSQLTSIVYSHARRFIETRFVSLSDLNAAPLPLTPDDFERYVTQRCMEQRHMLEKDWVPKCAKKIVEMKAEWSHLVPKGDDESLELPMKFFACIAAEMSNQLREMVVDSLDEFARFFEQYQHGNAFAEYEELNYVRKPAISVRLFINDPKIDFQPGFKYVEKMLVNCFGIILKSAEQLARVEVELFPFAEYKTHFLRSIRADEALVDKFIKRVLAVYDANKTGPQRYLNAYKKYADLMNTKADQDITAFLKNADNQLEDFELQINKYAQLRSELTSLLLSVPLNLYSLDCAGLHESLKERVQRLRDRLVQHCVDDNRDANKSFVESLSKNLYFWKTESFDVICVCVCEF